jgi:hypothetical protein
MDNTQPLWTVFIWTAAARRRFSSAGVRHRNHRVSTEPESCVKPQHSKGPEILHETPLNSFLENIDLSHEQC